MVFAAVVALAASCGITGSRGNGVDNYFSAFETFGNQQWYYASPAFFRVDTLRDSVASRGDLILSLRHTSGYAYSNLWLELEHRHVSGTPAVRDTFNIILADRFGRWRGHGTGPSVQVTDTLSRDYSIARGDTLVLRHIMRLDTLANIEQAGIVFLPE